MIRRAALCLVLTLAAGGCSSRPEVTARESPAVARSAYPTLAPIDQLIAASKAESRAAPAQTEVTGRAAALRARANALRSRGLETAPQS